MAIAKRGRKLTSTIIILLPLLGMVSRNGLFADWSVAIPEGSGSWVLYFQ